MRGRGNFRGNRRSFEGQRGRGNRHGYNSSNSSTPPKPAQNLKKTPNKTPTSEKPAKEETPKSTTPGQSPAPNTTTNNSTPTQVKRERSRSPIDRKNDSIVNKKETQNISNTNSEGARVKYTGRPGEKKFANKCRLFIANLSSNMTEDEVKALFLPFGELSESYFNKDKGFGFVRLDYRTNAEEARSALDKTNVKGRTIQVRFAGHASAIELHGLDQFASNELITQAMSQFGKVESAKIVCDERGKSRGYAIVEFEWKKSAQKVLDRFKDELFVLGRLPKPVFAKPLAYQGDDGIEESSLERIPGYQLEREFEPRFISPDSFDFHLARKWKDLYLEEQDKKARLDQELEDARYNVELEMESAIKEQDAIRIREELARRQEELRLMEEDIAKNRQMSQMGGRPGGIMGASPYDSRGPPPRGPRGPDNFRPQMQQNSNNLSNPADINLPRLRAALASVGGVTGQMGAGGSASSRPGSGILQQPPRGPGVLSAGPRGPPMGMRPPMMGPRGMPPRGGPRR